MASNQAGFVSDADIEQIFNDTRLGAAQTMFRDLLFSEREHALRFARMVADKAVRNAAEAAAIRSAGPARPLGPPRVR